MTERSAVDRSPSALPPHLDAGRRRQLLDAAEEAIRARLEDRAPTPPALPSDPLLAAPGASFVTLRSAAGALLGCIGTIEPVRPLIDDVAENAVRAAFADPRLPPLTPGQFPSVQIKVSVLTPLEPLSVTSVADLEATVRPGVDGLLIQAGRHRGTFLPSVWEQVADRRTFLGMLWQKAGLEPDSWPLGLRVWRYGTEEFGVDGPRRPIAPAS